MVEWARDDSGFSIKDIEKKQPYKMQPHHFTVMKKIPWLRCKLCGLLTLKNALTEWCMRMGCNASDHPEYVARCRGSRPKSYALL